MRALRAPLTLFLIVVLFAAAALGIGALILGVSDTDAHRAFGIGFYGLGGLLVLFALTTHGAEGRAYGPDSDAFLYRVFGVPEEGGRSLNPTGALAAAGLALVAIGVAFDAALS